MITRLSSSTEKPKQPNHYTNSLQEDFFKHYNKDKFTKDLQETDWRSVIEGKNTSEKWNNFKQEFIDICNINAPKRDMKITENKPKWLTNDLFDLMNVRDMAFRKAKSSKDTIDWKTAKEAPNHLNKSIMKAKRHCITETLSKYKNNHTKIWKKIKEHLPTSEKDHYISIMKDSTGNVTDAHTEIADILNNHFASIGPTLAPKIPDKGPTNLFPNVKGEIQDQIESTSICDVLKIIKDFPAHKSME